MFLGMLDNPLRLLSALKFSAPIPDITVELAVLAPPPLSLRSRFVCIPTPDLTGGKWNPVEEFRLMLFKL